MVQAIRFRDDALELIDQRRLPQVETWVRCTSATETAEAIRAMVVRGAPAIGITAAYGLALAARGGEDLDRARRVLLDARPTAVNLRWALDRLSPLHDPDQLLEEARRLHREDIAINRSLGEHGADRLADARQVYHHCNTGALATGGWGTALGVIRSMARRRDDLHAWVGETRPYLQGARLSAWELLQEGIDCTLVTDSTAASLMGRGDVDAVLVGCDRVAANGDTANKIGTLSLAVLADHYGVPFYVCMPTSTLDRQAPDGASIPIEERSADEVRGHGGVEWAADVPVYNPAFDVTPAELVTGWVTEFGVWDTPFPAQTPEFVVDEGASG